MEITEVITPTLSRGEKAGRGYFILIPRRFSTERHYFPEGGFLPKAIKRILKKHERQRPE